MFHYPQTGLFPPLQRERQDQHRGQPNKKSFTLLPLITLSHCFVGKKSNIILLIYSTGNYEPTSITRSI